MMAWANELRDGGFNRPRVEGVPEEQTTQHQHLVDRPGWPPVSWHHALMLIITGRCSGDVSHSLFCFTVDNWGPANFVGSDGTAARKRRAGALFCHWLARMRSHPNQGFVGARHIRFLLFLRLESHV